MSLRDSCAPDAAVSDADSQIMRFFGVRRAMDRAIQFALGSLVTERPTGGQAGRFAKATGLHCSTVEPSLCSVSGPDVSRQLSDHRLEPIGRAGFTGAVGALPCNSVQVICDVWARGIVQSPVPRVMTQCHPPEPSICPFDAIGVLLLHTPQLVD